jgi:hypothetical protein
MVDDSFQTRFAIEKGAFALFVTYFEAGLKLLQKS